MYSQYPQPTRKSRQKEMEESVVYTVNDLIIVEKGPLGDKNVCLTKIDCNAKLLSVSRMLEKGF